MVKRVHKIRIQFLQNFKKSTKILEIASYAWILVFVHLLAAIGLEPSRVHGRGGGARALRSTSGSKTELTGFFKGYRVDSCPVIFTEASVAFSSRRRVASRAIQGAVENGLGRFEGFFTCKELCCMTHGCVCAPGCAQNRATGHDS